MRQIAEFPEKIKKLAKGGFFHIFVGNMLTKMIAFISSIVVVRLVNKNDYAYLTFADNLYNYVNACAGLGMVSAILKFCAVAKTKEEDKAYFTFALKYGTLFQTFLVLVIMIYVTFFPIPFPNAKEMVYILVLYPILNNVLSTIMSYIRAHGNNKLYAKIGVVQTAAVFVGSVLFVILMDVKGIALSRYIAISLAFFCVYAYLKGELKGVKKTKLSKEQIKGFMVMSFSLMISSLFSLIMPMNEMTLVNELLRDEIITANYKVAIMIPSQLSFVTQSIVIYYFTIIAKMEDKKEIWKLSKRIGIVSAVIIVGITVVGVILSPYIIRIVYGERYEDAISLAIIFWVAYALNASMRLVPMNFLPAIGVAKFNAVTAGCSCIFHLAVTYVAISEWGIYGAGIATGLVYLVSGMVYWLYLRKKCLGWA